MPDDSAPSSLQKQLEEFFTPELATALSKPGALHVPLRHVRPEFILALVRDDDPMTAREQLGILIDLALAETAAIDIFPPLAIITWGGNFDADAPRPTLEAKRQSLVTKIAASMGQNVAMVHGSGEAVAGFVGGDRLMHYGSLFAGFSAILKVLTETPFGEIQEWRT